MGKYTNKLKLEVVKFCIDEHHGYLSAAKHFNIRSEDTVLKWVRKYKSHGEAGLFKKCQKYDGKFKQSVIEYMHENHLSLFETAIKFNIGNHSIVGNWERIYYEEGPQALYIERRGRKKNIMNPKPKKKKLSKNIEEDLIAENQRLRAENAYLKKLNALVQERIERENKKKQ